MDSESKIVADMRALMNAVTIPPAPVGIAARAPLSMQKPWRRSNLAVAAAACVVLSVVAIPLTSQGVVQTLQQKIEQIIGWSPPSAPEHVLDQMRPRIVTIGEARTAVRFTLTAPTGAPADAHVKDIMLIPTASYNFSVWTKDSESVAFEYTRSDGRVFTLMAAKADPNEAYSKYMFKDLGSTEKTGPLLKRYDRAVWSNGDQVITAMDDGISLTELDAIRASMGGVPIATEWPVKHRGRVVKLKVGPNE